MKKRILFIDDNEADNFFVSQIIEIDELPIEAAFVANPVEALRYLEQVSKEAFPQIIITDLNMPLMDGFGFINRFEAEYPDKISEVGIFIMSTTIRASDREQAIRHRTVVDFVEKPFTAELYEFITHRMAQR